MVGHVFPVFLKFQGGKAVATFIGAFLYLTPLPLIAARCVEIGRDPATLRVSLSVDRETFNPPGAHRRDMLEAYRERERAGKHTVTEVA